MCAGTFKQPDHPWNLVVTVGQRVRMKCKPDNSSKIVDWPIQRPISQSKVSLWSNWKEERKANISHYDFDVNEDGSVVLLINSTQLDDAGIYTCVIANTPKQPEQHSAQLIVFGKSSCDPPYLKYYNSMFSLPKENRVFYQLMF